MKKLVLSIIFCFVASNLFAITAKEVYEKSLNSSGERQLSKFGSYIMEYDVNVVKNDNINTISYRHVWDGEKQRIDTFYKTKENVYSTSLIRTDKASYVSSKGQLCANGKIVFTDYQIFKNTADVLNIQTIFNNVKSEKNYDDYEFKFNNVSNEVNSGEYAVSMKVKNREEVIKNYEKEKNQKNLTEKDWALQIAAMFDMEYFIDKNNFHINGYNMSLNAAGEECENESENFGFKVKFSDYRKIGNTNYVYPYNMTSEVKMGQDIMIYKVFIKSIKPVNSKDVESEFIPANVKEGEGKLPDVLSKNNISFQYFLEKRKTDMLESFSNAVKEKVEDGIFEAIKRILGI
ncbi:MAG: hypothetical protein LBN01_01900 [Endomicrobium sp.]|jgi:hypothetical protein|nr:hypothetical protein [Endomicrobium sp.]